MASLVSGDAEMRSSLASEPLPDIFVGTAGIGRVEVLSQSCDNFAIDRVLELSTITTNDKIILDPICK